MANDVDWAFDQYEAVRDALPRARHEGEPERFDHLSAALEPYDLVMLDAFGVLNVGETAIPGAVDLIASLRARGKRVVIVSNSASVPTAVSLQKFHRLGFDFTAGEIVTSRDALKIGLEGHPPMRWGVMATAHSQIEELGIDCFALRDDVASYDAARGFVLLGSGEWTDARQDLLSRALSQRPRPVLVGNPDIVAPRETGLSLEPGYYAHDLARRTGCALAFYGKPFGNIFDIVAHRLGPIMPSRSVLVGDTLHTDVLGGAAYGIKTILLENYGLFAGRDVQTYIARSGIVPGSIVRGH